MPASASALPLNSNCDKDADDATFSSRAANPKLGKARGKALDLERTAALIDRIADLQDKLYAQRKQKVLLILQGMDTAGKDGTVRALFRASVQWACVRWASSRRPTTNWRTITCGACTSMCRCWARSPSSTAAITRMC
jgi:polyphosphate kinase 2 (PPK2 family)